MIKKVASLLLAVVIAFAIIAPAHAGALNDETVDTILEFLADENIFNYLKPLLITNSGVDLLISLIENSGNSTTAIGLYIDKLLGKADKDAVISTLNGLQLIDEDLRVKYADIYEKREKTPVSQGSLDSLGYFLNKAYARNEALEKLFSEYGFSEEFIASLLKFFADINNGIPLLTDAYDDNNNFAINSAAGAVKRGLTSDALKGYINRLNSELNTEEKLMVKGVGSELGFYTPFVRVIPDNASKGVGYAKSEDSVTISYSVVSDAGIAAEADFGGVTLIEIVLSVNGVRQDFGALEKSYTVKIPVTARNVMAYKLEGRLTPVKYSFCDGSELFIQIESTGYYGVKYVPKYFEDANGWGSEYIESLYARGIINGKADKLFAPEDYITREEFVKLIVELFGFSDESYYAGFSDVGREEWYYKYVAIAYKHGIIDGIGGNLFGTGQHITRQDMCKIIADAIDKGNVDFEPQAGNISFPDEKDISGYALEGVLRLAGLGIVSGDEKGCFNPQNNATRQEAAKIIHMIIELYVKNTL